VEGGPRVDVIEHNSFHIALGREDELPDTWTYGASIQLGSNTRYNVYQNNLYGPRITTALSASGKKYECDCIPH